MSKNKEKDTTIWKPKGNQKITRPSGPEPGSRRARKAIKPERASWRSESNFVQRSQGYDAPKSNFGKLSLLIGVGAIIAALAKGVKNSDYFKNETEDDNNDDFFGTDD